MDTRPLPLTFLGRALADGIRRGDEDEQIIAVISADGEGGEGREERSRLLRPLRPGAALLSSPPHSVSPPHLLLIPLFSTFLLIQFSAPNKFHTIPKLHHKPGGLRNRLS